jgi:FkbM family methyltransferase
VTSDQALCVQQNSWPVRILPQVATAVYLRNAASTPGLSVDSPGVMVLHHFSGTWKVAHGYASNSIFNLGRRWLSRPPQVTYTPVVPYSRNPSRELYPVSVDQDGAVFTVMVNLIGHGDMQSHEDVSAALTRFGNWQAGMDNSLEPRAPVALIEALCRAPPDAQGNKPVLLDVGAGLGAYTLTAAARGHRVIATELAVRSNAALCASIKLNGYDGLVHLHNVTLGAAKGRTCVEPAGGPSTVHGWRREDVERGYAAAALHQQTAAASCSRLAQRVRMGDLVPAGVQVGAVRVSAGAWTGEVLRGALPFLAQQQPAALLLEVDVADMARVGNRHFLEVMRALIATGYGNMAHAGTVCVKRFEAMLGALAHDHARNAVQPSMEQLKQPAWCELNSGNLADVLEQNRRGSAAEQDGINTSRVELFFLQLNSTASAQ